MSRWPAAVLMLFCLTAIAQEPPAQAPADEASQLSQLQQTLEQLGTYLQTLDNQIEVLSQRAAQYLDMADAESDPQRQARFEQLHTELSFRLDELMHQREQAVQLQEQALEMLEQLDHDR